MQFSELPHATRFALREIAESLGARIEGYYGGGLAISHKPSADRLAWSFQALQLDQLFESLGATCNCDWKQPADIPDDPYAGKDGYLFSAVYCWDHDPLPACSAHSKQGASLF